MAEAEVLYMVFNPFKQAYQEVSAENAQKMIVAVDELKAKYPELVS